MIRSDTTLAVLLIAALSPAIPAQAAAGAAAAPDAWWQRLNALCGQAFEGRLVRAPDGDQTFRAAAPVMHVRDCADNRIRIPLAIGDDLSRTWVFERTDDGIHFSHDHRDVDGAPDTVTGYGGTTSNPGSADTQLFPADAATAEVIPGSGLRSVWLVEIRPGDRFVYAANRVGTERGFLVEFDLTRPVEAPPAPWGWTD